MSDIEVEIKGYKPRPGAAGWKCFGEYGYRELGIIAMEKPLEIVVGELLRERGLRLAVAEIVHRWVDRPSHHQRTRGIHLLHGQRHRLRLRG